eukprot:tig00001164_g7409.t1
MARARFLVICIDGIADVAVPGLGWRSPLEAARIPALDSIAESGAVGLMDPVQPGLACGSDTAHMSMLGYPPWQYYRGRGAFESLGAGLPMSAGDVAFKCNFAYVDDETEIVVKRRADRNFEGLGPELCAALDGLPLPSFPQHRVTVRYATEHRCGLSISGPDITDAIGGTDPLVDGRPLERSVPLDKSREAELTARLVNELSDCIRHRLRTHPINAARVAAGKNPANAVLLRGPGCRLSVEPFEERHGLRPFMIAPTCIIAGLGISLGMHVEAVPGATGDYHTDLQAKARAAAELFARAGDAGYDFGFVHVKAVDDAGHDRNAALKVEFLERCDAMVASLLDALSRPPHRPEEFVVCVTGDHSTPVDFGDHSHEPVPFAVGPIPAPGGVGGRARRFTEAACAQGELGRFPGAFMLDVVKRAAGALLRLPAQNPAPTPPG